MRLVGVAAGVTGAVLGAVATLSFIGRLMNESVLTSSRAGIVTKVSVLNSLREGKTAQATEQLEAQLDGDIIGLLPFIGSPEATQAARAAATYRRSSGYESSNPEVRAAVRKVLLDEHEPD